MRRFCFQRMNRESRAPLMTCSLLVVLAANGALSAQSARATGDAAAPQLLTIPFLANATKPADLDFAAAQCDVAPEGQEMTCRFRQVFLTVPSFDLTTCVMTTNGYEQTFRRQPPDSWVSTGDPSGECGIVETTTLEDGGGVRWTMTIRRAPTKRRDAPTCQRATEETEVYSWRGVRRALPCATVQPGAIER